jgi:hypothetical protein
MSALTKDEAMVLITSASNGFVDAGLHRILTDDQRNRLGRILVGTRGVMESSGGWKTTHTPEETAELMIQAMDKLARIAHGLEP